MTKLHASLDILCPYSAVFAYLATYLGEHRGELALSVPLADLGLPSSLVLQRDVCVRLAERPNDVKHPHRLPDTVDVSWTPVGGGPFPTFSGTLRLMPMNFRSRLVLQGEYQPPLGAAGQVFDLAVGRHIADRTAQRLLEDLRASLESQWFAFTTDHALAQHEANVHASPPSFERPRVFPELAGRVTFRVDGSYLGCCIMLDGEMGTPLVRRSGSYPIDEKVARSILTSLVGELAVSVTSFSLEQDVLEEPRRESSGSPRR